MNPNIHRENKSHFPFLHFFLHNNHIAASILDLTMKNAHPQNATLCFVEIRTAFKRLALKLLSHMITKL